MCMCLCVERAVCGVYKLYVCVCVCVYVLRVCVCACVGACVRARARIVSLSLSVSRSLSLYHMSARIPPPPNTQKHACTHESMARIQICPVTLSKALELHPLNVAHPGRLQVVIRNGPQACVVAGDPQVSMRARVFACGPRSRCVSAPACCADRAPRTLAGGCNVGALAA